MPHLALIVAVAFWASSATAIKVVLTEVSVYEAVALRYLLAAIALWVIAMAVRQIGAMRRVGWRPFLAGMVEPGIVSVIGYNGMLLTTAVHATVIFTLMPLISSILGRIFLKEAISPTVMVGAIIGLGGTIMLVANTGGESQASLTGDLLVILAIFMVCVVQLTFRRVAQQHGQPALVTAMMMSGAAVSGFVVMNVVPGPAPLTWIESAPPNVVFWFLYSAVLVSTTSFLFTNYALRHLPVGRAGLYTLLTAPIGVPIAWFVLGERISATELYAIPLIVLGVALPAISNGFRSLRSARARRIP